MGEGLDMVSIGAFFELPGATTSLLMAGQPLQVFENDLEKLRNDIARVKANGKCFLKMCFPCQHQKAIF